MTHSAKVGKINMMDDALEARIDKVTRKFLVDAEGMGVNVYFADDPEAVKAIFETNTYAAEFSEHWDAHEKAIEDGVLIGDVLYIPSNNQKYPNLPMRYDAHIVADDYVKLTDNQYQTWGAIYQSKFGETFEAKTPVPTYTFMYNEEHENGCWFDAVTGEWREDKDETKIWCQTPEKLYRLYIRDNGKYYPSDCVFTDAPVIIGAEPAERDADELVSELIEEVTGEKVTPEEVRSMLSDEEDSTKEITDLPTVLLSVFSALTVELPSMPKSSRAVLAIANTLEFMIDPTMEPTVQTSFEDIRCLIQLLTSGVCRTDNESLKAALDVIGVLEVDESYTKEYGDYVREVECGAMVIPTRFAGMDIELEGGFATE